MEINGLKNSVSKPNFFWKILMNEVWSFFFFFFFFRIKSFPLSFDSSHLISEIRISPGLMGVARFLYIFSKGIKFAVVPGTSQTLANLCFAVFRSLLQLAFFSRWSADVKLMQKAPGLPRAQVNQYWSNWRTWVKGVQGLTSETEKVLHVWAEAGREKKKKKHKRGLVFIEEVRAQRGQRENSIITSIRCC